MFLGSESVDGILLQVRAWRWKRSLWGERRAVVLGFRGGKIGLNSILLVWFPFLEKDPIFLFLCVIFLLAFLLNAGQEGLGMRYPRPSYWLFVGGIERRLNRMLGGKGPCLDTVSTTRNSLYSRKDSIFPVVSQTSMEPWIWGSKSWKPCCFN